MFAKFQTTVLLGVLIAAMLAAGPAGAATLTVGNTDDSGSGSLRQAMIDAAEGDTIEFSASATGTIVLLSPLPQIVADLSIEGPGADVLTISGAMNVRPFSVAADVQVTISGLTIADGLAQGENGSPGNGGGISNQGGLTLRECAIVDNVADSGLGGGIDNFAGATLVVERCVISRNIAEIGGGIASEGTLNVVESSITDNVSTSLGGGIDNSGSAAIVGSLIAGNTSQFGGGIGTGTGESDPSGGDLFIANSTLSQNAATGASASGGAIDSFDGVVELVHATIARNQAPNGGGIWTNNEFYAKNSLIAENEGGDCTFALGIFQVFGINLDTDDTCVNFDTVSVGALALGQLADNGGETLTNGLGNSSVALDAAVDCTAIDGVTPIAFDQRGVERPQGSACDAGAFEAELSDLIFANGFE